MSWRAHTRHTHGENSLTDASVWEIWEQEKHSLPNVGRKCYFWDITLPGLD